MSCESIIDAPLFHRIYNNHKQSIDNYLAIKSLGFPEDYFTEDIRKSLRKDYEILCKLVNKHPSFDVNGTVDSYIQEVKFACNVYDTEPFSEKAWIKQLEHVRQVAQLMKTEEPKRSYSFSFNPFARIRNYFKN